MRERLFVYAVVTVGLVVGIPQNRPLLLGCLILAFAVTEVVHAQRRQRRRAKRADWRPGEAPK